MSCRNGPVCQRAARAPSGLTAPLAQPGALALPRRRIVPEPTTQARHAAIDRSQIGHAIKDIVKAMPTGFVLLLRLARWGVRSCLGQPAPCRSRRPAGSPPSPQARATQDRPTPAGRVLRSPHARDRPDQASGSSRDPVHQPASSPLRRAWWRCRSPPTRPRRRRRRRLRRNCRGPAVAAILWCRAVRSDGWSDGRRPTMRRR